MSEQERHFLRIVTSHLTHYSGLDDVDLDHLLALAKTGIEHPSKVETLRRKNSAQLDVIKSLDTENDRLRAGIVAALGMLSEMGVASEEKCQMAYDHLLLIRSKWKED